MSGIKLENASDPEQNMNTFCESAEQVTLMHTRTGPITIEQRHRMHHQKLGPNAILAGLGILGSSSDMHGIITVYTNMNIHEVVPNARTDVTEQLHRVCIWYTKVD